MSYACAEECESLGISQVNWIMIHGVVILLFVTSAKEVMFFFFFFKWRIK